MELQNNFTTIEQSKRLLELGLPADTSDCYIYTYDGVKVSEIGILRKLKFTQRKEKHGIQERLIPCWSVGRLIEIFCNCAEVKRVYYKADVVINNLIESVICDFEYGVKMGYIDFSKLETI